MWFVYIVECSDGTLYTGVTTYVHRRIDEHNSGPKGAKYTRNRRPVKLRLVLEFETRSLASKEEYRIKQLTRAEKFQLIKDNEK